METNEFTEETKSELKIPLIRKFILIFTNPSEVFKDLSLYPNWIIPTIVILILSIFSGFVLKDIQMETQKDAILKSEKIPAEQKSKILEDMEKRADSPIQYVMMFVGVIVYIFGSFTIVAALFLFTGNIVLGGTANYKAMLMVYAWGYLVAIPELIIKVPLILMKNTMHVYTSLAIMFDPSESNTVLFKLANAIDIFAIWRIALWAIGFSIVYKFSKEKSTITIASWYVIWVAITIGLSFLTGGLFGF